MRSVNTSYARPAQAVTSGRGVRCSIWESLGVEMKGRSDAEYLNDSALSEHQYMCLVKKEDINPTTLAPNVVNRKLHELREYIYISQRERERERERDDAYVCQFKFFTIFLWIIFIIKVKIKKNRINRQKAKRNRLEVKKFYMCVVFFKDFISTIYNSRLYNTTQKHHLEISMHLPR